MKAVAKTVEPAGREATLDHIRPQYLEALTLVERLHRRLLDVIKDEFDRRGRSDINSVQALLLYNIGDKELTAGELRTRGYYLGSNVSYNLKKLVEMAFLDHQRSRVDRRSVRIKLTDKGREVRDIIETLYQKHVRTVEQVGGINAEEFSTLNKSLHRLERFWTDQILYRPGFFLCLVRGEAAPRCCGRERSTAQCLAVRCRYAISGRNPGPFHRSAPMARGARRS
jgi:DNA-binding MarR family transcriptional regulator